MRTRDVRWQGEGREIEAYLAEPEGEGLRPALIVVHEIWGLDDHIRDVARRFAAEGFVALAPDLYTGEWREAMQPDRIMAGMQFLRAAPPEVQRDPKVLGPLLDARPPAEAAALRTLMRVMNPDQRQAFARELRGGVTFLQGLSGVDGGRVACLGFCMGGGITAQLATLEPSLAKAVIFYGESPPLERVAAIEARVLGLYGGEDARITATVPALADAMAAAGKAFTYHVYPEAPHAFFNDTRPTYRPEAARDAFARVLDFLA
jgi:carboxymethylenebutenolidase